jgi:hypothetical protein
MALVPIRKVRDGIRASISERQRVRRLIMRQILILTASLLTTCTVDIDKLRHHSYPDTSQPDLVSRSDLSPHLDTPSNDPSFRLDETLDSNTPDATPDLAKNIPDTAPKSPIGTNCILASQCSSNHCTDNVCCNVAQCTDTCVPTGITTCPPYSGWTCAPYGTCRGY